MPGRKKIIKIKSILNDNIDLLQVPLNQIDFIITHKMCNESFFERLVKINIMPYIVHLVELYNSLTTKTIEKYIDSNIITTTLLDRLSSEISISNVRLRKDIRDLIVDRFPDIFLLNLIQNYVGIKPNQEELIRFLNHPDQKIKSLAKVAYNVCLQ